jgi:uncharacterized repeat protein (TIGR03803 family)
VARAQKFSVLYSFGSGVGGENPGVAGLIADSGGNLYGTTAGGGDYDYGTVYQSSISGGETVLYSFTGGADGAQPRGADLLRGAEGSLYGVTPGGGNFSQTCPATGCGVVFRVNAAGQETVLYSFTGGPDGTTPYSTLIRGAPENLYGAAYAGGNFSGPCASLLPAGCGVIFELSRAGQLNVLYTFTGLADGSSPSGNLILDAAGNLYGTAQLGGTYGYGVVFKLDPAGNETVLYNFTGGADGGYPIFLTRDAAGNFYGTTGQGGDLSCSFQGCGVVFRVDPEGSETVLYSFAGGADGAFPDGGVLLARGSLYGTTSLGGDLSACGGEGCGTVFKLTSSGEKIVLHDFQSTDGQQPEGSLLLYEGYLYGTTFGGGRELGGVVYSLTP